MDLYRTMPIGEHIPTNIKESDASFRGGEGSLGDASHSDLRKGMTDLGSATTRDLDIGLFDNRPLDSLRSK